jgi:hypothetical protein
LGYLSWGEKFAELIDLQRNVNDHKIPYWGLESQVQIKFGMELVGLFPPSPAPLDEPAVARPKTT